MEGYSRLSIIFKHLLVYILSLLPIFLYLCCFYKLENNLNQLLQTHKSMVILALLTVITCMIFLSCLPPKITNETLPFDNFNNEDCNTSFDVHYGSYPYIFPTPKYTKYGCKPSSSNKCYCDVITTRPGVIELTFWIYFCINLISTTVITFPMACHYRKYPKPKIPTDFNVFELTSDGNHLYQNCVPSNEYIYVYREILEITMKERQSYIYHVYFILRQKLPKEVVWKIFSLSDPLDPLSVRFPTMNGLPESEDYVPLDNYDPESILPSLEQVITY